MARRSGYRIIVCDTGGNLEQEADYLDDLISHRVDGLVIAPVSDSSRTNLTRLSRHGMPFVLIDRIVPGIDCDVVQGDSRGGAIRAGQSFDRHRTPTYRARDRISHRIDRPRSAAGLYRRAVVAAGIEPDDALIIEGEAANTRGGRLATLELLQRGSQPTAIFAVNNLTAVGVIIALRELSLRVPADVSVVCFDDIELASPALPIPDRDGPASRNLRNAGDPAGARPDQRQGA